MIPLIFRNYQDELLHYCRLQIRVLVFGPYALWLLDDKYKCCFYLLKKTVKLIYYSCYNGYRMTTTTTIQLSTETKRMIGTFGTKEDTYDNIIRRIYDLAVKAQLREFLLSSHNTIPIDEAIRRAKAKWQK